MNLYDSETFTAVNTKNTVFSDGTPRMRYKVTNVS
jgi:hypothetical protein